MKTRGYWNKEANIRAESINNKPIARSYKNYTEYKLENKSNAKTIETFLDRIKDRIVEILDISKKIVFTLTIHLSKLNALNHREIEEFHFVKAGVILNDEDEKERVFESLYPYFLTKIQEEMVRGSGWQVKSIDSLQVKLIPFSSSKGGNSTDLPENLKNSNSVLHFRNNDEKCLQWSLTHGMFPGKTKIDRKFKINSRNLDWEKMYYPSSGNDIKQFERNNNLSVFSYGLEGKKYYTYYKSSIENDICLLFYNNHFFPIQNEKIFHKFLFKSKNCFVCKSCMNNFSSQEKLDHHKRYCQEEYQTKINYPKKGKIFFQKHSATLFHPISFYMDIEAYLSPIDKKRGPKTRQYQKHNFAYLGLYEVNKITGENVYRVFDNLEDFEDFFYHYEQNLAKHCEEQAKKIPKIERKDFPENCAYCEKSLDDDGVIHHCHFTGKFLGIVHNACNLQLKKTKFIPIFCHNLMKYDEKFLIRFFGETKIIAKNLENFISFSVTEGEFELRFIDTLKFLNSSLEKLVENLKGNIPNTKREIGNISGKGVFPYDWFSCMEVLDETCLPPIEKCGSLLYKKECSLEDYAYMQQMWEFYKCKTMRDFLLAYLKSDCILLSDCFENFRNLSFSMFGLDPVHYVSLPSLSFDCFLKTGNIFLEKISEPTIYNFIESGIKGGESFIAKRYALANNRYMKDYDPNIESSFLCLFDMNSLYPTNMCKNLPYQKFKFVDSDFDWENNDCFLDVDISVPEDKKKNI